MKVGIALGGGGVRGLAHILALEIIDSFGLKADRIAGTSMGAIIGSLYASGHSGQQIREGIQEHYIARGEGIKEVFAKRHTLLKWWNAIQLTRSSGGFLKADGFFEHLQDELKAETFEELAIPFQAVAADFYRGKPVVFDSGPLMPAIQASMSIPGVFVPVQHQGKILVDGGVVNNLPYDLLMDDCDVTIALDVAPTRDENSTDIPNIIDASLGMFDILVDRVTEEMLADQRPTLYVRPVLKGIRVLDFDKIESVFEQSRPAMEAFKKDLGDYLDAHG
jgi:NTE family protein